MANSTINRQREILLAFIKVLLGEPDWLRMSHYFVLSLFPLLSGTAGSHPDNLARSSAMVGGHFATTRHFALTILVQDFARLLIPPVVVFLALVAGEHLKRVNRQLRI